MQEIPYMVYHPRKGTIKKSVKIDYNYGDSLPEFTKRVLSTAKSYLGKKVQKGLCSHFIMQVIADMHGKTFADVRYHWTDYIKKVKLKDIRPGDVIEYKNADIGSQVIASHVAIVWEINNGVVTTLEQNVGGSPVIFDKGHLHPYSGKVTILRITE